MVIESTRFVKALPQAIASRPTPVVSCAPRCPDELRLPRHLFARILAARTGHGDFADYHERFNHEDAHLYCRCGARKSPVHFFFCRVAKRRLPRPSGGPLGDNSLPSGNPKRRSQAGCLGYQRLGSLTTPVQVGPCLSMHKINVEGKIERREMVETDHGAETDLCS